MDHFSTFLMHDTLIHLHNKSHSSISKSKNGGLSGKNWKVTPHILTLLLHSCLTKRNAMKLKIAGYFRSAAHSCCHTPQKSAKGVVSKSDLSGSQKSTVSFPLSVQLVPPYHLVYILQGIKCAFYQGGGVVGGKKGRLCV